MCTITTQATIRIFKFLIFEDLKLTCYFRIIKYKNVTMIQSILLIIFLPISSSLSFRRSHGNMSPIDDPTILASSLQQQFTDQNKPIDDSSTKASSQYTPRFSTSSKPKPEPGLDLPQARSPTHAHHLISINYIYLVLIPIIIVVEEFPTNPEKCD